MLYQRTVQTLNFIQKLSEEQKIIFLKAFAHLARADGDFEEIERKFIMNIAGLYGISEDHMPEILAENTDAYIIEEVAKIKDRRAAMELVKEMCMLAHVSDDFGDAELLFISKVGQAMGIEPEKIEQISKWVIDRIIWLEEGKLIFEEV